VIPRETADLVYWLIYLANLLMADMEQCGWST